VAFVILFLAGRHLDLGPAFRGRLARVVVVVGTLVAAVGIFEFVDSAAWNHFVVFTLRETVYQMGVLHSYGANPFDIRLYSALGHHVVLRVGSTFLDALSCAFYLVFALVTGVELLIRHPRARWPLGAACGLMAIVLLLTQTRAAILGGGIAFLLTVASLRRIRPKPSRARRIAVAATVLAILVTAAVTTGFADRTVSTTNGTSTSAQVHLQRSKQGLVQLVNTPLGRGLGTGASNGNRFFVPTATTSEDYYLQVGNETGVVTLIIFAGLVIIASRRLLGAAKCRQDVWTNSTAGAFVGLSVTGLFLQVWLNLPVSWTVWLVAGVCLGPSRQALVPDAARYNPFPTRT
ncbi:MAG: O-antigen ligase family protein, partial [Actinomycetota bacterium]|nr:O-antigen ligase family protein [Actinomycetota bacterium]